MDLPPVPELFAGVVSQDAAVAALRAAAANPVHAYLFRGPPGNGGLAAAYGFAAALLCPEGGAAGAPPAGPPWPGPIPTCTSSGGAAPRSRLRTSVRSCRWRNGDRCTRRAR